MDMKRMFNCEYVQQQAQQQHEFNQICQVQDSVKKLKDFLESTDKIEMPYQNMASLEFCSVIFDYMKNHGMM
jgi:hypothetical protein